MALLDPDGECSYAELDARVDAAVSHLLSRGMHRGDRLGIVADKRTSTIVWLLGALRLGAIAVPINPRLLPEQAGHVLQDSGASLLAGREQAIEALLGPAEGSLSGILRRLPVVVDPACGDASVTIDPTCVSPEAAERARTHAPGVIEAAHARPAALLYTSGTTASPKGVIVSAANLAFGADSVAAFLELSAQDRILALMPFSFDYGLNQVLAAIHVGASAVLFDALLPRDVVDLVVRHRVTGLPAVPHWWNRLCRLSWPAVPDLRYATNTGGHLSEATSARLRMALPHVQVHAMYGFTEAFRATTLPPALLPEHPDSVGTAVPHARILVVDERGAEMSANEVGELIQSGPLVALGYWNAPAQTGTRFRPRSATPHDATIWAWSGDLFRRDERGLLHFVSRRDDLVKLHGYRVNPAEIERALLRCPEVRDACIVCVPHPSLGEAAVAIVAADAACRDTILAHVRSALPAFMRPEHLTLVETLPTGPHGKVDRRRLRTEHDTIFAGANGADEGA